MRVDSWESQRMSRGQRTTLVTCPCLLLSLGWILLFTSVYIKQDSPPASQDHLVTTLYVIRRVCWDYRHVYHVLLWMASEGPKSGSHAWTARVLTHWSTYRALELDVLVAFWLGEGMSWDGALKGLILTSHRHRWEQFQLLCVWAC